MNILLLSGADFDKASRYGDYHHARPRLQPYNLLQLGALAEENGHSVTLLDTEVTPINYAETLKLIKKTSPDLLGITVYSINIEYITELLKQIRSKFPNIKIVLGGPHVKLFPDNFIQSELADYCISGESEMAFIELLNALQNRTSISTIANLIFSENGQIQQNPERPFIEDLDALPYPAFHLIKNTINSYWPQPMTYKRRPMTILVTSRGCPYSCSFCPSSGIWNGQKWRAQSAEYVGGLIKKLVSEYGIREICFNENSFAINKKRVIGICKYIIDNNLDIKWTANVNARSLDQEMLKYMKRSGCWLLSVGLESGDDAILSSISKPITIAEAKKILNMIYNTGIEIRGYFMIGHIKDTKTSIERTIAFSKELPLLSANFSIFVPVPGSKLFTDLYGHLRESDLVNMSTYATQEDQIRFSPDELLSEEVIKLQKKAMFSFFIRPTQIFKILSSIKTLEDLKKYWLMTITALKVLTNSFIKLFIKKSSS